jgi:hypothetical protein
MKVKELIKQLQGLNPNADVVLGSDAELNSIYREVKVSIYDASFDENTDYDPDADLDEEKEVELTPENVAKIKSIVIWGW